MQNAINFVKIIFKMKHIILIRTINDMDYYYVNTRASEDMQ